MSVETRHGIVREIVFWAQCVAIAGIIVSAGGAALGWWP